MEKVIKGLEHCTSFDDGRDKFGGVGKCGGCPYYGYDCTDRMKKDALALLNEQDAVEPTLIREGRNKYYNNYVCPRCDNDVVYEQNYCSECGVKFMWESR